MVSAAGAAQTTWIVDWQGGPGSHFRDLPPALAVATPGDTIVVRPLPSLAYGYLYNGGTVSRGITIVGEMSPRIGANSSSNSPLIVRGLPAGETCTLRGLTLVGIYPWQVDPLRFTDNDGLVVAEDLTTMAGPWSRFPSTGRSSVSDCAGVVFTRCRLGEGHPGLEVRDSTVAFVSSTVEGYDWQPAGLSLILGTRALVAERSALLVAATSWIGGAGWVQTPAGLSGPQPSAPAARLTDTAAVFAGSASSSIEAGSAEPNFEVPALEVSGGALLYRGAAFRPAGAAPPVTGATALVPGLVPELTGPPAVVGQTLTAELRGHPLSVAAFFVGPPRVPLPTAFGTLWVDPTLTTPPVTLDASGIARIALPIANRPELRNQTVGLQAAVVSPNDARPALSNPLVQALQ